MKTSAKILAVAIVAMFCSAACIVAVSDDSDADKVIYHYYIQLKDDTINAKPIQKWLGSYDATSQSKESYLTGLKKGLDDAGLKYVMGASGWLTSIDVFATHGDFDFESDYYSFAVYYADGKEWKATSTYEEGNTFAIVFDKYLWQEEYDKLSDKDKEKYHLDPYGYATKLPTVSTTDYKSGSDMTLYIIIGAIIVVALVVVVFVYVKKNKTA